MPESNRPTPVELCRDCEQDSMDPLTAADIREALNWLDTYTTPEPSPTATSALLERVRPYVPQSRRRFRTQGLSDRHPLLNLLLLQAQVALYRPLWWLGTGLVALVSLIATPRLAAINLSPTLLVPPLVVGSVLYSFRSATIGGLEIELSCPVRPSQVVLMRMLLVIGWITGLGAVGSLFLRLTGGAPDALVVLAGWSGAVLLFAGLTLTATIWAGPVPAVLIALLVWGGLYNGQEHLYHHFPFGNAWSTGTGPALAGVLLLLPGIVTSGRLRRFIRE